MTAVASETIFRSDNGLMLKECCCCSQDGCVKDISTEYYDSGMREMYSEMILDTFNINLKESKWISKLYICNYCILQLKKAVSFKCNILKNYEATVEKIKKYNDQTKQKDLKYETLQFIEDQNYEDRISEGLYDGDEHPSDLKIFRKSVKRKREIKPKQHKEGDDVDKKQETIEIVKNIPKVKSFNSSGICKSTVLRKNSLKLISNSSIWVFNWSEGLFRCFCCKQPFSDKELLKNHTESHKIEEIERKIQISENNLVKVEVSDVFCKICLKKFDNLPSLIDHFSVHNVMIEGHILVPMKINELICQICKENHTNFHSLYLHMFSHYQSYICDKCGSGFYQKRYLKRHLEIKHNPLRTKKKRNLIKCNYCPDRFKQFHIRIEHMVAKHGLKKPEFSCNFCAKVYLTKGILNAHIKNSHEKKGRVECDVCSKTLCSKTSLNIHKDTHTDSLNHFCSICNQGFKLKSSLGRHVKKKHKS